MAVKSPPSLTLGEALMAEKLITQDDFDKAVDDQRKGKTTFARALVQNGAVNEGVKLGVFQKKLNIPVVSLANVKLAPMAADRISREICEQFNIVAWKVEGQDLCVAMEDPTDKMITAAIHDASDMQVKFFAAKSVEIAELVKQIPRKEAAIKEKGKPSKILGALFLFVLTFVPILGSLALYIFVKDVNKTMNELISEPFELALAFFLITALWTSLVYFIHGMLFGSDDDDEPEYIP